MRKNTIFQIAAFAAFALIVLLPSLAHALNTTSSCASLPTAGETYILNQSVNISGATCFTVAAQNVTLDCNGWSITGDGTPSTAGVSSTYSNTTVKNCNITKFYNGIYLYTSGNSTIQDTSISRSDFQGIYIELSDYVTIRNVNSTHNTGSSSSYFLSQQVGGDWIEAGVQHYSVEYETHKFSLDIVNGEAKVRVVERNMPFGDIEAMRLDACGKDIFPKYAAYVSGGASVLGDVLSIDNNVAVAHENEIEAVWEIPGSCKDRTATLYLTANEYGNALPFVFPAAGSASYRMQNGNAPFVADGRLDETDGIAQPAYSPYWEPSTGHPPGNTYIYIDDNGEAVHFSLDITMDNSDDKGKDWAELQISSDQGMKKFRINDSDSTWGACSFGATSKAGYNHQACEFSIPKSEIGNEDFNFSMRYYGTGGIGSWSGVALVTSGHATIASANLSDNRYGVEIYSGGAGYNNFTGILALNSTSNGFDGYYGDSPSSVFSNINVSGASYGIWGRGANFSLSDINALSTSGTAIRMESDGSSRSISNVNATGQDGAIIFMGDLFNYTVSGINATAHDYGISINQIRNSTISDVNATSTSGTALSIYRCSNSNFTSINPTSASGTALHIESSSNNTFTNITAASTSGIGFYLLNSQSNAILNSTFSTNASSAGYSRAAFSANGSAGNNLTGSTITAPNGYGLAFYNGSTGSMAVRNSITAQIWVYVQSSANYFNDSEAGNKYYFANGSGAWAVFDILDTDGDGWADAGTALPFNATTVGSNWSGNGSDWHPYVPSPIGNASNISTSVANLSASIAGSTNITGRGFDGNLTVNITSSGDPILVFNYNFSSSRLNFTNITIGNGLSGGKAYASVSGIPPSALVGAKTLYLYNASPSYTQLCVKDEESVSYANISLACTGTSEYIVTCDSTLQYGRYNCISDGTTLAISGLNHSAVIQFAAPTPSPTPTTGGGGTPSRPATLTSSFDCIGGNLNITATSSGSPLSGIRISLTESGNALNRLFATTGSGGIAHFTITGGGRYSAEASGSYYGTLPSTAFMLCSPHPAPPQVPPTLPHSQNQTQPEQPRPNTTETPTSAPEANQTPPAQPALSKQGELIEKATPQPLISPEAQQNAAEAAPPAISLAVIGGGVLIVLAVIVSYLFLIRKRRRA